MWGVRSIINNIARRLRGFTIVEILIVIVVIAILVAISIVGYQGIQHRSADALTQHTVADVQKTMQLYYVMNKTYPPNIANTEYAAPETVSVALYTDAAQTPVYQLATEDQNAQLFINTCASVTSKVTSIHYTGCTYAGNNVHVSGAQSANVVLKGPTVDQADVNLQCGSSVSPTDCSATQSTIISTFLAQGGHFPIKVPKHSSTLPAPTLETTGPASAYCVQAASDQFTDIIYHAIITSPAPETGPCPADLGLHYP